MRAASSFRVAGNLAIDALRREQRLAANHDGCDGAAELAMPGAAPEAMLLAPGALANS